MCTLIRLVCSFNLIFHWIFFCNLSTGLPFYEIMYCRLLLYKLHRLEFHFLFCEHKIPFWCSEAFERLGYARFNAGMLKVKLFRPIMNSNVTYSSCTAAASDYWIIVQYPFVSLHRENLVVSNSNEFNIMKSVWTHTDNENNFSILRFSVKLSELSSNVICIGVQYIEFWNE